MSSINYENTPAYLLYAETCDKPYEMACVPKRKRNNTECKLHYHILLNKDTLTLEKEYHTHQIQQTYQEEIDIHAYVTHLYEKYFDNVPEASYSRYGNAFDDTLLDKAKNIFRSYKTSYIWRVFF